MWISLLLVLVLPPVLLVESHKESSWSQHQYAILGPHYNRQAVRYVKLRHEIGTQEPTETPPLTESSEPTETPEPDQHECQCDNRDDPLQRALQALNRTVKKNHRLSSQLQTLQEEVDSMKTKVPRDFIRLDDGWILAFRGTSGIGASVYGTWINKGHHDDDPLNRATLPCGCTTLNGSLPCDRHYRSRLLDVWPSSSIDQVKLALYEKGVEKHHITFAGAGTDYKSWFSHSRIIESSWVDLKAATNLLHFGMNRPDWGQRNFYIVYSHNGCADDVGWLTVKDGDDVCGWGKVQHKPAFLYSTSKHRQRWTVASRGEADVMAVLVKFRPGVEMYQKCK